jgi:hypothetical protein
MIALQDIVNKKTNVSNMSNFPVQQDSSNQHQLMLVLVALDVKILVV